MMPSISQALRDPALLGAALGPIETWLQWLAVLQAAFGEVLSAEEIEQFARVAGNRPLPGRRVRELWSVIGRRGGKSRIAAAIAAYLALFVDHWAYLAPGETGFVLTVSMSRDQAQSVHDYCLAFIEASPVLRQEIAQVWCRIAGVKGIEVSHLASRAPAALAEVGLQPD